MASKYGVYRVHIHKVKQEDLYRLLESMPRSARGLYIRDALEEYSRTSRLLGPKPKTQDISLRDAFDQDFGGTV